jgi:integrase/recombinase XerD
MAKRIIKQSYDADTVTMGIAFDEFVNEKEAHNLSTATLVSYKTTYELFCKYFNFDNETAVDVVTHETIYDWINGMKRNELKPTSVNHYLRDIRAFLYWCMDADRRYIQPFKIQTMKAQEEQLKTYTDAELRLLLQKPKANDSFSTWRSWCIVNWVLATGNRASTICEIKLTDVDFISREIVLGRTKNKKLQIIPLSSSLETVLKEYIRRWRRNAPADAWMFPNVGEEQLTRNALRLSYERYTAKCGVNKTNIHGLRHNFAKGWVRNNGNMFVLQKVLGHSSLEMTRKYVRLFSEDIKNDYDSFSPLDTIKQQNSRVHIIK